MRLARRIRKARQQAKMSQLELATRVGVGRSAVANWEGTRGVTPSSERLLLLARVLEVNLEWLATGRGTRQYEACADEVPAVDIEVVEDPMELRLLRAFRAAPGGTHRRILDFTVACALRPPTESSQEARSQRLVSA